MINLNDLHEAKVLQREIYQKVYADAYRIAYEDEYPWLLSGCEDVSEARFAADEAAKLAGKEAAEEAMREFRANMARWNGLSLVREQWETVQYAD